MPWLVCPEDDRLIEIDDERPYDALMDMADHIYSAHAEFDPMKTDALLHRVEQI